MLSDERVQAIVAVVLATAVAAGVPGAVGGVVSTVPPVEKEITIESVPVDAGAFT
jgi:hypothetical protein